MLLQCYAFLCIFANLLPNSSVGNLNLLFVCSLQERASCRGNEESGSATVGIAPIIVGHMQFEEAAKYSRDEESRNRGDGDHALVGRKQFGRKATINDGENETGKNRRHRIDSAFDGKQFTEEVIANSRDIEVISRKRSDTHHNAVSCKLASRESMANNVGNEVNCSKRSDSHHNTVDGKQVFKESIASNMGNEFINTKWSDNPHSTVERKQCSDESVSQRVDRLNHAMVY